MSYELLKWVHIISATLLFGTGLGSAFYKWCADRSGDIYAITHTNRIVVIADWIFTTPTVFIQPISGFLLAYKIGVPLTEPWLLLSIVLFVIAGLCWLPVVWLQIRMRDISKIALAENKPLGDIYQRYLRIWLCLGFPAFISILVVVYLMIAKPTLSF